MSGNTKKKRYPSQRKGKRLYWDTCVFLAWIKDESVWPEDVKKGIAQTIEMAMSGEVTIVTSALTMAEILEAKMTPEQKHRFAGIFAAPYLQLVDLDRRISTRSSTIRDYHDTRRYNPDGSHKSGSFMRMPDAIHLATAIHMNVTAVHTLDGSGKNPRRLDMLELDGNVGGFPLAIRRPAFIPPPKFSDTPIEPVSGPQRDLFTELEVTDDTTAPQETEPITTDVRRSGDRDPEDFANAEVAKDETEGAKTEGEVKAGPPTGDQPVMTQTRSAIEPQEPSVKQEMPDVSSSGPVDPGLIPQE
jgi:predicted nucleic acid-binding protein